MGLLPDEVMYIGLINVHCIEGELSKALRVDDKML